MSLIGKPVNLNSSYLVPGPKAHVLNTDPQTETQNVGTLQFRATNNKGPSIGPLQPRTFEITSHDPPQSTP